ncbi:efflux RND transporter periplasmic adaptor subunit [Paracoccus aurantiacus]|nr:efflux RND transporter periplasmic adaptor subunit [Paracoccus aurantiacus]
MVFCRVVFCAFLSALAVLAPVGPLAAQEAGDPPADATTGGGALPVTVVPATVMPIEIRVPASGSLVARELALVYPQLAGDEITELLVEEGDRVTKGQVLARLSDLTVKAQLAQADAEAQRADAAVGQARSQIDSTEATLAQAAAALERTRQLQRGGSATRAALDEVVANEAAARAAAASARDGLAVAEAARAQANAALDLAKLNRDRTSVTSPVDGIVSERSARLGALGSAAGDPMFTIIADGTIEWQADVVETALNRLKVGDPVLASVAGMGEVPGVVRLLPAAVDPVTRLGEMRISLDQVVGLRSGLFASGWVIVDRHDGVAVPLTAVLEGDGAQIVQVVRDGIVETREIKAGAIWKGNREILTGLASGEQVIERAGAFFRDGDKVSPVTAEEPPAESTVSAKQGESAATPRAAMSGAGQ